MSTSSLLPLKLAYGARARAVGLALVVAALAACEPGTHSTEHAADETNAHDAGEHEHDTEPAAALGPHGGRLLEHDGFTLELAIFESGVPPEYHAWARDNGVPVEPPAIDLEVTLGRLDGTTDRIAFTPAGDRLRGAPSVAEPHSFDVTVTARHAGRLYEWSYESYEGRTHIPAEVARAAGIETALAGSALITETTRLYGSIVPDPNRVRSIAARFPGAIVDVAVEIGERVTAGQTLVTIEANDSLRRYTLTAPIAGVVTARHAAPGEQTDSHPLLEIADFSSVWAELAVFASDRERVRMGAEVLVIGRDGARASGTVDYLTPIADPLAQRTTARVVLDNAAGTWLPGQFVEAEVTLATTAVEVAVPLAALQTFRDFDVVFARIGEDYEVRMLELGRRGADHVEVVSGLEPGSEYVVANSYLVKADIEKAGASHDH